MYIHISAVKDHLRLIDAFQLHHHRLLTVQQDRRIQHRTAMLIAVRRGIAPSAAPVHTQRQFHGMGILHDVCRFIVAETAHRSLQHFRLDGSKALLHLVLILQHHTKVIMQAELLTEICPCKAFFQPVSLDLRQCLTLRKRLCRYPSADCFCQFIHPHKVCHTAVPCDDGIRVSRIKTGTQRLARTLFPVLQPAFPGHKRIQVQCRRYRFPHGVLLRIKLCRPEGMVSAIPEIRTELFCHLIQIPAKQPVFLRIILHAKDPHDEFSVTLLQPMQDHTVRDHLIVDIHKGKDTVVSHLCTAVDIGYLQIAVLPNGGTAAQHAVIPGCAAADAACHTAAPAKAGILLHAAAHQCKNLPCSAKVDKLRRGQTQQLHPVRTKHLPYLFPRFCQLLTEFPFRLFQIKLLQCRVLR